MNEEHPAMIAARASWDAVRRKDKEAWLALMADDIVMEDPIGVSPLDPVGKGHQGKEAIRAFYDKNMAPNTIEFEVSESFAAGMESAHRMALITTMPTGTKTIVNGIFTYRVNDDGKLVSLRGFWELADIQVVHPE